MRRLDPVEDPSMVIEIGPLLAEGDDEFHDRAENRTRVARNPLAEPPPLLERVLPRRARPIVTAPPKPRARPADRDGVPIALLVIAAIAVASTGFGLSRWIGPPVRPSPPARATSTATRPSAPPNGLASRMTSSPFASRAPAPSPAAAPHARASRHAHRPPHARRLARAPRRTRAAVADPPFELPTNVPASAPADRDFTEGDGGAVAFSDADLVSAGRILYGGGDYARAEDAFKKALKSNEGDGEPRFWLAKTYAQQSKSWRACHHFRKYLDLFPDGTHAPEVQQKVAECDG